MHWENSLALFVDPEFVNPQNTKSTNLLFKEAQKTLRIQVNYNEATRFLEPVQRRLVLPEITSSKSNRSFVSKLRNTSYIENSTHDLYEAKKVKVESKIEIADISERLLKYHKKMKLLTSACSNTIYQKFPISAIPKIAL